jgi:hypothetical protein
MTSHIQDKKIFTGTDGETLRFLYDKRLILFNVRRDHEWKVFFGVMTLIGAVDAAIVTQHVCLTGKALWGWRIILIIVTGACIAYEFGVQRRNRVDRIAMHEINTALCDLIGVTQGSSIRCPADHHIEVLQAGKDREPKGLRIYRPYYLWAFIWQIIVLISVCVISLFMSSLGCRA